MAERLFSSPFTLGILGGGQLGKMILSETRRYDIRTAVLDPSEDAPCRIACNVFTQGSLTDEETVRAFGEKVDVLTIEIEHVSLPALEQLEKAGKRVYPQPAVLKIIQNKGQQKQFYLNHGLPTADFEVFSSKQALLNALDEGRRSLPFVWKATTGGYDGKGVAVVKSRQEIHDLPEGECLWEALVPFEKEVAVVVARSSRGEVKSYPMVDMDFHPTANLVEFVVAPSRYPESVQARARELAEKTAAALGIVGLLAVEMFLTTEGNLLINEAAPRVHNSGHLTIEASKTSQFEQHLRAILGLPLGSTDWICAAAMGNLVGEAGYTGPVVYDGMDKVLALPGVNVHLYGKAETRPYRKMGHLTAVGKDQDEAIQLARTAKESLIVKSI